MLDDRDYMRRRPQFELQWSMTVLIVALNAIVFVIQNAADDRTNFPIFDYFALGVNGLKHGHVWQLLTFQFLHATLNNGGIFHLLGNCFAIYMFGRAVEQAIGHFSFLKLYLLSGALGGALQMAIGGLWPEHFGQSVVGASAGAFGLLAAFATLFPRRLVQFFFLPFPVRADILLAVAVPAAFIGLFVPYGHTAHCAHLGGILWGFILARKANRARNLASSFSMAKNFLNIRTVQE